MAEKRKKLLIVSDSVSGQSGLARIARDIAVHAHTNLSDLYELATAGYGGCGSAKLGFQQYHLEGVQSDWVLPSLQEIVEDFAGKERCIVLFIWDPSRLGWFSQPERLGSENLLKYPGLKQWLIKANIERWIYAPVDASGPNDRLTFPLSLALQGFDRILAYGPFGEGVIRRTLGDEESDKRHVTNLPHGINGDDFWEQDRALCRKLFVKCTGAQTVLHMLGANNKTDPISDGELLIGCVCTNQPRKDLALTAEIVAILSNNRLVRFWLHTDRLEAAYSIPSLLVDYGILQNTVISMGSLSDLTMGTAYSACDVTIAPGLGEGMGYPIFESLFCRTPCFHGNYGGAPHWMNNPDLLVEPVAYRYEGSYSCKRPVFRAQDFVDKIIPLIGKRVNHNSEIDWVNLWPRWERLLRDWNL